MRGAVGAICAVLIAAACDGGTGPDLSAVAGAYVLERVDGAALPAPLAAGDCPETVVEGELGLEPRAAGRRPLYGLAVFTQRPCAPPPPPGRGTLRVEDVGEWAYEAGAVRFRSDRARGTYAARPEGAEGAGGPILTLRLDGRAYTFRRVRR